MVFMIHLHLAIVRNTGMLDLVAFLVVTVAVGFDAVQITMDDTNGPDGRRYTLPALSQTEKELFRTGLLVFPSNICWFEMRLQSDPFALQITEIEDSNMVWRFDSTSGSGWGADDVGV